MKDFISELKKIETDRLIYSLSKISIEMLKENKYVRKVPISALHYGRQPKVTYLLAWDIPNIVFLSIKESNDYRHSKKIVSPGQLVSLYRKYDNEHSAADYMKNAAVLRVALGMTAEQFQHQNLQWIYEKFNRDYYILLAAEGFKHRSEIDTNSVVKETLGYSADDYIAMLLMVCCLCSHDPDPLTALKSLNYRKEETIFTTENITKLIEYYSCTYNDLREHRLGKQFMYSKPFIKTQRTGSYLAASAYLVEMLMGNGLYWLVRDYYLKQGNQKFVNAFGLLFEDYIEDLATNYCKPLEWEKLSAGPQKGADFMFDFGSLKMLIESKSSLLKLDAKQQVPNLESVEKFFNNTMRRAYKQLSSSYERLKGTCNVPIVKIILLYDEFSNTSIIELSMGEIFEQDPSCYVMTIREFEMLLYIHHNDKTTESTIMDKILESIAPGGERKNLGTIYSDLAIYENLHFNEKINYFSKFSEYMEKNLK